MMTTILAVAALVEAMAGGAGHPGRIRLLNPPLLDGNGCVAAGAGKCELLQRCVGRTAVRAADTPADGGSAE